MIVMAFPAVARVGACVVFFFIPFVLFWSASDVILYGVDPLYFYRGCQACCVRVEVASCVAFGLFFVCVLFVGDLICVLSFD